MDTQVRVCFSGHTGKSLRQWTHKLESASVDTQVRVCVSGHTGKSLCQWTHRGPESMLANIQGLESVSVDTEGS